MLPPQECWNELAARTRAAADTLPELPSFAEALALDREAAFRDLGYTFWNRELLDGLAARLRDGGPLRWVELAAGTGRLAAELARRGVDTAATDDYSQAAGRVRSRQRSIEYGAWVACLAAREAMERLEPEGALCAWPPLGSCLVPDLLAGVLPGSRHLRWVVCIGEPGGATEAPAAAEEMPPGWALEEWPECARWLSGFNDPAPSATWKSHARLLIYRRLSVP